MNTQDILTLAKDCLDQLPGQSLDVIEVKQPANLDAAGNLAKIVSKLSPLVGNLIEFDTCNLLNQVEEFSDYGKWKRQDPGFPDTIFEGSVSPTPGVEIKAWFPLATEITARFKDSQNHFLDEQTDVAMLAWLPEFLIFGKPMVLGLIVVPGSSIAKARDNHYHNPPDYLVFEPEDTAGRTANLQQSNTNGYKFQGDRGQFAEASSHVDSWGVSGKAYQPTAPYQKKLNELLSRYPYRLDTNFAKMDRIEHPEIESFKSRILELEFHGKTIKAWNRLLAKGTQEEIQAAFSTTFGISEAEAS